MRSPRSQESVHVYLVWKIKRKKQQLWLLLTVLFVILFYSCPSKKQSWLYFLSNAWTYRRSSISHLVARFSPYQSGSIPAFSALWYKNKNKKRRPRFLSSLKLDHKPLSESADSTLGLLIFFLSVWQRIVILQRGWAEPIPTTRKRRGPLYFFLLHAFACSFS